MSKSAILRKALEYVRYLQQMNAKLQKENMALRMAAQKNSPNGLNTATYAIPGIFYLNFLSRTMNSFF